MVEEKEERGRERRGDEGMGTERKENRESRGGGKEEMGKDHK